MPTDERRRLLRFGMAIIGAIVAGLVLAMSIVAAQHFEVGGMGAGQDARAYWQAVRSDMPYGADAGTYGAYLYSPAFAQVFGPLLSLPWPQFLGLWTAMLMGVLLLLAGPLLFVAVLPLAFIELWGGNIHLLLALAIVAGFRFPPAWAFVVLTKVTPGIGLVWFAARREWRGFIAALATTAAVVVVSMSIDPQIWHAWVNLLTSATANSVPPGSIPVPLGVRLPFAALVVVYAAITDRRWLVPVGALLALPVLWWGSLSLLIAIVALERERLESAFLGRLSTLAILRRPAPRTASLAVESEG